MFNKAIVAIDKVIDESGWDEPQKAYASSMINAMIFSLILFIPVFLVLLAVIISSDESIFTVQNLLRLVFVIIVLDAMRNSGSK
jgi:hypothetical protein